MGEHTEDMRGTKGLVDGITQRMTTIRRKWDDGDYDDVPIVDVATRVARGASSMATATRDATRRIRDDYDGLDIWNLGDRLVLRFARLIDESIRTGTYSSLGESVTVDDLRRMSDTFKAASLSSCGYEALWHLSPFREEQGQRLLDDAYDAMQEAFLSEWARFGETFLTVDMRSSASRMSPIATLRLRLGGIPDSSDLDSARRHELRRMVAMMREFCQKNFGVPIGYGTEDFPCGRLVQPEDGWEKEGVPLAARFWGNPDVLDGKGTVEEAGTDYVAYTCDLVEVTETIEAWQEWLDGKSEGFDAPDATYASLAVLRTTGNEELVTQIEDELRRHFLDVWKWFGNIVMGVWM